MSGELPRTLTVTVELEPMTDGDTLHLVEVSDRTWRANGTREPDEDVTMCDRALCEEWVDDFRRTEWTDPTPRCEECLRTAAEGVTT